MAKAHAPGFLSLVNAASQHVQECSVESVKTRIAAGEPLLIVDVREESEFSAGHIPGAVHLSKGVIERDIEARIPDHNKEMILYCGGGFRSILAAFNLKQMGYTKAISMTGGWSAWNR